MEIPAGFISPGCAAGRLLVQVGRYEILEVIGSGAYSQVARAHDPMIGRLVAINCYPRICRRRSPPAILAGSPRRWPVIAPSIITLHDMGIDEI